MNKTKISNMIITALLTAFAIIIPVAFGFLRVYIPPAFTATLTLHVPIMVAMFISPVSAVFVAAGSAIGFIFTGLPPVIAARAGTHILFALVGAVMIRKMAPFSIAKLIIIMLVTMPLHSLAEIFVVIPFLGEGETVLYSAFFVVGVGTAIHHMLDYIITIGVLSALSRAKLIDFRLKPKKAI